MSRLFAVALRVMLAFVVAFPFATHAQQTMGGITGQVTDATGAALQVPL